MHDLEQTGEPLTPAEVGGVPQSTVTSNTSPITGPDEREHLSDGPGAPLARTLPPTLETLPGELRIHILSYLDLDDLRAAVHASPVLHRYYVLDRRCLLGHALRSKLGSTLVDAYAVREATCFAERHKELQPQRVDGDLDDILGKYFDRRSGVDGVLAQCSVEDLVDMASFYRAVMQPLLLECPDLILQKLDTATEVGVLSETERTRFLRALYRFQVFHLLFGQRERLDSRFGEIEILAEFFGRFQPWEIEEVNCIDQIVRATYDSACEHIVRDTDIKDPRIVYSRGYCDLKSAGECSNPSSPPPLV